MFSRTSIHDSLLIEFPQSIFASTMTPTSTTEIETQGETPVASRKPRKNMKRFFSTESTVSSLKTPAESYRSPHYEYDYSLGGKEFILKLMQLLMSIISAGLYSNGLYAMPSTNISSMIFPNVVFGAFIIITSVIAMSYVLGQVMPEILIRIFNAIGTILHFVSACVTGYGWFIFQGTTKLEKVQANMLFIHALASLLNSGLYGVDLGFSVKKALATPIYDT